MQLAFSRRGIQKPGGVPRLNPAHPLSSSWVFFAVDCGGGYVVDIVSGLAFTAQNATRQYTTAANLYGGGNQYTGGQAGNGSGMSVAASIGLQNITSAPFTLVSCFTQPATTSFNNNTWIIAGSGNFYNWVLWSDNAGQTVRGLVGTAGFASTATAPVAVTNGPHTSMALAVKATTMDFYVNGVFANTTTVTFVNNVPTDPFCIGSSAFGNQGAEGAIPFAAMANRILTAAEVKDLHFNPWASLLFPEDDVFATLVGVAAVVPPLIFGSTKRNWLRRKGLG